MLYSLPWAALGVVLLVGGFGASLLLTRVVVVVVVVHITGANSSRHVHSLSFIMCMPSRWTSFSSLPRWSLVDVDTC